MVTAPHLDHHHLADPPETSLASRPATYIVQLASYLESSASPATGDGEGDVPGRSKHTNAIADLVVSLTSPRVTWDATRPEDAQHLGQLFPALSAYSNHVSPVIHGGQVVRLVADMTTCYAGSLPLATVVQSLWLLAKFESPPSPSCVSTIFGVLHRDADHLTSSQVAAVAWSLGALTHVQVPSGVLDAVVQAGIAQITTLTRSDLKQLVFACVSLGRQPPLGVWASLGPQVRATGHRWPAVIVANVCYFLAEFQFVPDGETLTVLRQRFIRIAEDLAPLDMLASLTLFVKVITGQPIGTVRKRTRATTTTTTNNNNNNNNNNNDDDDDDDKKMTASTTTYNTHDTHTTNRTESEVEQREALRRLWPPVVARLAEKAGGLDADQILDTMDLLADLSLRTDQAVDLSTLDRFCAAAAGHVPPPRPVMTPKGSFVTRGSDGGHRSGGGAGVGVSPIPRPRTSKHLSRWYRVLARLQHTPVGLLEVLEERAMELGDKWRMAHVSDAAAYFVLRNEVAGSLLVETVELRLMEGGVELLTAMEAVPVAVAAQRLGWWKGWAARLMEALLARARNVAAEKIEGLPSSETIGRGWN